MLNNKQEINDLIDKLIHKDLDKNTTSKKFKYDLVDFFCDSNYHTVIEIGCYKGNSTRVLAELFTTVYALDNNRNNILEAMSLCEDCENIEFYTFDAYDTFEELIDLEPDVIWLDGVHDYHGVEHMLLETYEKFHGCLIIMDDYGHEMNTVKPVLKKHHDKFEIIRYIGESAGYVPANGKIFLDSEGVIFKWK